MVLIGINYAGDICRPAEEQGPPRLLQGLAPGMFHLLFYLEGHV